MPRKIKSNVLKSLRPLVLQARKGAKLKLNPKSAGANRGTRILQAARKAESEPALERRGAGLIVPKKPRLRRVRPSPWDGLG